MLRGYNVIVWVPENGTLNYLRGVCMKSKLVVGSGLIVDLVGIQINLLRGTKAVPHQVSGLQADIKTTLTKDDLERTFVNFLAQRELGQAQDELARRGNMAVRNKDGKSELIFTSDIKIRKLQEGRRRSF